MVPPAGFALGLDATGRAIVVLRLHPAVAVTARLAGVLARNPWLAGKIAVRERASRSAGKAGSGSSTRRGGAACRWHGGSRTAGDRPADAHERSGTGLAAGSYRLERRENLVVPPEEADGASVPALPRLGRERLALFAGERGPGGTRAFVLWREEGDVPDVATLGAGDVAPRSLPGEALLRLGGRPAREEAAGGWRARGYSGTAVADALALGADAEAPFAALGAAGGRLIWADRRRSRLVATGPVRACRSRAGRSETVASRQCSRPLRFRRLKALLPAEPVAGELPAAASALAPIDGVLVHFQVLGDGRRP